MTIDQLIHQIKENEHYLTNVRCEKCYTIFLSKKGDKFSWDHRHKCFSVDSELEIEDERWIGGSCGYLITIKEEEDENSI